MPQLLSLHTLSQLKLMYITLRNLFTLMTIWLRNVYCIQKKRERYMKCIVYVCVYKRERGGVVGERESLSKTSCDRLLQNTFSIDGPPCPPRVGARLVAMRGTKSNTSNVLQNKRMFPSINTMV